MKIYAVADIHGRADRFQAITAKARETKADVLVMAGDIGAYFSPARCLESLTGLPLPVMAVRGNSDRAAVENGLWPQAGVASLHLNKIVFDGFVFSGISGAFLLPFTSRLCFSEAKWVDRHHSFFEDVSVLVAHPPPRGVLDRVLGLFSAGSPALRRLVAKHQPSLVICGHIHENPGTAFLGETLIVNCSMGRSGTGALIDLRPGEQPLVEML